MNGKTTFTVKLMTLAVVCVLAFGLSGCARSVDPATGMKTSEINDPIEPLNRGVFAFNDFVDRILIEPIALIYKAIFPWFVRDGIQNFMHNLEAPLIVANNLLQGDVRGAGVGIARFVINTTAGVGGLVDAAADMGMPYQKEDFGQTLAVWGFGDGFYIVLPIIGPSSLRDGVGLAVNSYADPVRIIAHNKDDDWAYYTRVAVDGIDTRSRLVDAVRDLRKNSLDYYAAVRSAYAQKRQALIHDESPGAVPIPDYDDSR